MKRRHLNTILAAALVLPAAVRAADPPPFPEFTFKRITVPPPGTTQRITVQIDPTARIVVAPPAADAGPLPKEDTSVGHFAWFWDTVSPDIFAASSDRLEPAVNALLQGKGDTAVPTPRLQDMQHIADKHGTDILKATIGTRVSPALVLAVIGIESSGKIDAVSSAGARGLMQLMPATAERFGVDDISLSADNIRGGVAYLDWLMGEFGNDPVLVLAAYNAGENAVLRNDGVPPYAETRDYVPKVLSAWTVARGLCLTPPLLISDGCVFTRSVASNG